MITQKYLKTILHYDSKTGHFTWLKELGRRGKVGTVAGNVNKCGYHVIGINRKTYTAHRLAYLYVNNICPKILDHINRIKTDNRIENIRPASSSNNQNNTSLSKANTSGYKGVAFSPRGKPWTAKIGKDGKQIYLGAFNTPEEAHAAYCEKGKEINGEFFCEG